MEGTLLLRGKMENRGIIIKNTVTNYVNGNMPRSNQLLTPSQDIDRDGWTDYNSCAVHVPILVNMLPGETGDDCTTAEAMKGKSLTSQHHNKFRRHTLSRKYLLQTLQNTDT